MSTIKQHKVVASLPALVESDSIYYVRVGRGFDIYVTNSLGAITSYSLNHEKISQPLYETRFPEPAPLVDQFPLVGANGNFAWWTLPIKQVFYEQQSTMMTVWMGDAITANGSIVVFPTNTNNVGGNTRFTEIVYAHCMVIPENGDVDSSVSSSLRFIAPDRKTVMFNCTTMRPVTLCGKSHQPCPDGLSARIVIIGKPVN